MRITRSTALKPKRFWQRWKALLHRQANEVCAFQRLDRRCGIRPVSDPDHHHRNDVREAFSRPASETLYFLYGSGRHTSHLSCPETNLAVSSTVAVAAGFIAPTDPKHHCEIGRHEA